MRNLFVLTCMILAGASCSSVRQNPDQRPLAGAVTNVVLHLDEAKFQPVREGWDFDYGFEDGAGMLNTYEYLRSLCSYEALQSLLPMQIYSRGPHTAESLDLNNPFDFGHYNPEFVAHFHATVRTLLVNDAFIAASMGGMRKHGLLEKLERLREIHDYIEGAPDEFARFKKQFETSITDKTWGKGDYRDRMPKALDTDRYWNWSESAYYFWVRRDLDGTKKRWINVINDILRAYGE